MQKNESVYNYYLRDDISVQAPGRKDTEIVKGEIVAKTYMTTTVTEAYALFVKDFPNVGISITDFFSNRPVYVKL